MIKKLILSKLEIHNFYFLNIIKRLALPLFDDILNTTTNKPLKNVEKTGYKAANNHKIHYITYIPPYVKISVNNSFKKLAFNRFNGFLIDLENFNSIQDYMSKQFGSKSRSKIRSYTRRVETCFNITYQIYFGDMDETVFKQLFIELECMIKRRFDQRGDQHQPLEDWNYYENTAYQNIINKNASLFVIYDNNKPIDICINYHFENIMINYIRTYDIDYSKFKLGSIDIFKQLEWCFENDIKFFDLGIGILTYKKQWCNVTYNFKNYIIYNKNSAINTVFGILLLLFYKLKIFLDNNKIILDKENRIADAANSSNKENINPVDSFELETNVIPKTTELNTDYSKINFELEEFSFLRNVIYDYLYLNFDHKNNVSIYKSNNHHNEFILSGKKIMKLTLKN